MSEVKRKILAMGGGGFLMEPENPLLDDYILSLAEKSKPKICFVGTASGDHESGPQRFYAAFDKKNCTPSHLSLFKPPSSDLEAFVRDQDILYVGGGNTKNLLALWRDWNLDQHILKAYRNGLVLSGVSAGMICWFEEGLTDSFGAGLDRLDCLGVLKGSSCPHFDGEALRRPRYTQLIREDKMGGGIALDDGVGALFINEQYDKCVSSRPNAKGFIFSSKTADEKSLDVHYLGK